MCQCVHESTHHAGGTLDVIITRSGDSIKDVTVMETGVSDHLLITGRLPVQLHNADCDPVEGRKWNNFSLDDFQSDLMESVLCTDTEWTANVSVDELFNIYSNTLTDILDKHAPRYVRKRKKRILTPWFDAECRQMKRRVRVLERKYRKSRDPADRLAWVTKLQEQTHFHQSKERLYWSTRINANAKNARALWRDLDDLMCRENNSFVNLSAAEAERQACNFLKFFEQKVETVRSETSKATEPTFNIVLILSSQHFS
jgi:hypothetical protein